MTNSQFQKQARLHPNMSKKTLDMVKAVLVDGLPMSDVSRHYGITPQAVQNNIKRFKKEPLVRFWVSCPQDKVKEIKDCIKSILNRHDPH